MKRKDDRRDMAPLSGPQTAERPDVSSCTTWRGTAAPDPSAVRFEPGQRVAGRYRISRFLARGGMGEVYQARDLELDVSVALKTLSPELERSTAALRRFKREVLLARSVSHRAVCRIYDLGRQAEVLFLTMELLEGPTLAARIRSRGRLSTAEALPLVRDMASGLGAAHRAGVVHRDFKSGNVMVVPTSSGERAVVTDFGLAHPAGVASTETESGRVVGTPAYMAPEQAAGEAVGPASDIYALGVVLFEMVTGQLPFRGENWLAVAMKRLHQEPPRPGELAPGLDGCWEEVILRCLERAPEARFAQAEEVVAALEGETPARAGLREPMGLRPLLPVERDAFVGREDGLRELEVRLSGGTACLTLVGPGGMGKTRLAVRYGWTSRERWPGGVWFCDMSEARGLGGIAGSVASVLGVSLGKGDPVLQLGHALAGRGRALFILDNFEQVVEHAEGTLGRWLERAPEGRFLVTSRERLGLPEEETLALEALREEEGVELFVARAQRQRPGFVADESCLPGVRQVVRLVEGLPLAIELAAARLRVLGLASLLERMKDRFRLLRTGGSGRHVALEAAIDGSWELLRPWEKAAFAQASVFDGGFTLQAAEEVLDLGAWPEAPWPMDVVEALVDKSLLRLWMPEGSATSEPRLGMYVTLQEYARSKLRAEGEIEGGGSGAEAERRAEERHGAYYARLGSKDATEALDRHGGVGRRRALARELDNLVAACRRAVGRRDGETATKALAAAWAVFELGGPFAMGVVLGQEVLAMERLAPAERGRALIAAARAHRSSGCLDEAREHYERALAIHRESCDRNAEAGVLGNLGVLLRGQGRMDEAREHYESALAIHREVGDRLGEGLVLVNLGVLHKGHGRVDEAREHYERALVIHREVGDRIGEGHVHGNLGNLHREQGQMDEAREHYERALSIDREVGDRRAEATVLSNLGSLHREQGRADEAQECYECALAIDREVGNRTGEGVVLGNLGILHREQGRIDEAREHYERARALFRAVGDRGNEGIVLGNLGGLLFDQGRVDEAREHYERALVIDREVGDRRLEGTVLGRLGELLASVGFAAEAEAAFAEGERLLRAVGDRLNLAQLLCARGEAHHAGGEVGRARALLAEAASLAADAGAGPTSALGRVLTALRTALGEEAGDRAQEAGS